MKLLDKWTGKEELEQQVKDLQGKLDEAAIRAYVEVKQDLIKMEASNVLTQKLKKHIAKEIDFHETRIIKAKSHEERMHAFKYGEQMMGSFKNYILTTMLKNTEAPVTIVVDDDKETEYITSKTGIDSETIRTIIEQHYGYLETLGLYKS